MSVAIALFIACLVFDVAALLVGFRRNAFAVGWTLLVVGAVCNVIGWVFYAEALT